MHRNSKTEDCSIITEYYIVSASKDRSGKMYIEFINNVNDHEDSCFITFNNKTYISESNRSFKTEIENDEDFLSCVKAIENLNEKYDNLIKKRNDKPEDLYKLEQEIKDAVVFR